MSGSIYKVRYIGIDTPEPTQGEWLAEEATEYNHSLVLGQEVGLVKDISDTDGGRLLRYVYVGDVFVNAEIVKAGLARATPYPPDVKHAALFKQLEDEARQAKRGLWAVQITNIFYDGQVPRTESDEYVEITNFGHMPANLTGWRLADITQGLPGSPSFVFPSYVLAGGSTVRVYTNEDHPEWGGFSFKRSSAIWRNTEPDTAALYDDKNREVSRGSYAISK